MPLVRIDLAQDRSPDVVRTLGDTVHRAMVETLKVPPDDKFQVITASPAAALNVTASYLGITYGPGLVIIQITLNQGRTLEQKRAFYRRVADDLHAALGVRREDVLISLVEVTKENWSFGNGEAQYATS